MAYSEVAHLLARIDAEYQAAQRGLNGTAITAPHEYITERMENLSRVREDLVQTLGETEGNRLFCERCFRPRETRRSR